VENSEVFQNPKSGSIKLNTNFSVVDESGKVLRANSDKKLCGCGLSQDKPFCDKSHANYVEIVSQTLEMARLQGRAIKPFGVWRKRAFEIRKRQLDNRLAAGENLVGIKFGGALIKEESEEKRYEGIFGYLTDAMEVKVILDSRTLIAPVAEAEVVFKLKKNLNSEISLDEVIEYVGEVAAGIEVFDCRYGSIDAFADDAIADNACSGAFVIGNWAQVENLNFDDTKISISVNGNLNQSVPASAIAGNPWQAVVNASKKLAEVGVDLPAGSIIFSGSATTGIPLMAGDFEVEITNLGKVNLKVS
jgi:2-oxo-3-hexenedioate decarboxylase